MLPDYDAEAIAKVMGLDFVSAADVGRLPGAPIDADAAFALHERRRAKSSRTVKVRWSGEVIVVSPDELPSSNRVPASPALIEQAVEAGLHRDALRHVAELLAGGDKSKVALLEAGVVPKSTLERRKGKTLSLEESERTERVARLFVRATRALGTEAEAREFMTAPHPELNGRSPFEAARTDLGARRVEDILDALEYGLAL